MNTKLTAKQSQFVDEYLIDLNAKQAYIRAGYKARENSAEASASILLRVPKVAQAIQDAKSDRAMRTGLTAEKVMSDIETIKRSCMREVPDPVTGEMAMIDPKAALKAAELEGKHLGIWLDKLDVSNKDGSLRPSIIKIIAA